MTDHMELVERLEGRADAIIGRDGYEPSATLMREAAACIREMVEWRPIETAPRDGTEIVGFDCKTGTSHVTWADKRGGWDDPEEHYDREGPSFEPTHWLPLPPAPGAEA